MSRRSRRLVNEEFSSDDLTIKRVGKSIQWSTHRTPEELELLKQRLWESRPKIVEHIRSAVDELTSLILKYSSFDLVAHLWLRNGIFNAETYREWDAPQRPHVIEYAALLELKSSELRLTSHLVVDGADISRAQDLMEGILRDTMWYQMARNADPRTTSETEALRRAEFFGMFRYMVVGPPAYTQHWIDVLDGLFGGAQLDQPVRDMLGFSYQQMRLLTDAVGSIMLGRITDRIHEARRQHAKLEADLTRYMSTGHYEGPDDDKVVLDRFRNMRPKDRKRTMQFMIWSWAFVALADQLSFTASELAAAANTSPETARQFLSMFEVTPGSTPKGFLLPSPKHTLQRRLIVKLDEKWFCPVPYRLLWAIKPCIEERLHGHESWEAYQAHRASFLVREALRCFERLLPQASVAEALYYPIGGDQEAELDGLVIFDRYAYLIEGKAGGRSHGMKADGFKARLGELVGDAARQAIRARNYIQSSEHPTFRRPDGTSIEIDKSRVTEFLPITVSLDSLDVFTSELSEIRSILAIQESIWAICLTDLRAISEILLRPSEFAHYLRWRLSVGNREDVFGDRDEMNWLGLYLKNGPTPPRPPVGFDILAFTSHTEEFDNYFMHKLGDRETPASRPAQHIPKPLDELIDKIEKIEHLPFTDVTDALLDCSFPERDQLAQCLIELSFLSSRGRGNNVAFEAALCVFSIYAIQIETADLARIAREIASSNRKSAVVLAVDPSRAWHVYGWHLEPAPVATL